MEQTEKNHECDLIKNAPVPIYEIDFVNRKFVCVNEKCCQLTGYSQEEMLDLDPMQLLTPPSRLKLGQRIQEWLKGIEPATNVEYEVVTKSGEIRICLLEAHFTRENGLPKGAVVVGYDITDRKKIELSLKQALDTADQKNNLFNATMEAIPDGFVIYDSAQKIIFCNEVAKVKYEMFQPKLDQQAVDQRLNILKIYKYDGELMRPEESPIARSLKGETVKDFIITIYRPNGVPAYLSISSAPLRNSANEISGVASTMKDITEIIESQNIKRQNEMFLKNVFEASPDGFAVVDEKGHILNCNDRLLKMLAFISKEELIKHDLRDFIAPDDVAKAEKNLMQFLMTGKLTDTDYEIIASSGHKFIGSISVSVVKRSAQEVIMAVIIRDVTAEHEIDKAKTEFISMAAHQLRTPLSTMSLSLELLRRDKNNRLSPDAQNYLKFFTHDIRNMTNIINTFLDVSRLEMGKIQISYSSFDLAKALDWVIKEFERKILLKNISIIKKYDKSACPVESDPKLLHLVLNNVISNAIKYNRIGGTIVLDLARNADNIIISVADTGIGIAEDEQSKIFTKLFRAKNHGKTKGIGIGLYAAKFALEKIGGKIRFESKYKSGTTFHISLPLMPPQ